MAACEALTSMPFSVRVCFTVRALADVSSAPSPGSCQGSGAAAESLGWDTRLCGASQQPRPPAASCPRRSSGRPAPAWQSGSLPSDNGQVLFLVTERSAFIFKQPQRKNMRLQHHGDGLASLCQRCSDVSGRWVEEWTEDELH